jgi:iron-sulfur cluster repair protein YtfE (RIC family)
MNPFELLKKDHEKVAGLFEKLDATTERAIKTRDELFTKLKNELDLHARIEESLLYPALQQFEESSDLTMEAIEEHRVVKRLLAELEAEAKDTEEWTAKLTVLKENVEHHIEEEEKELFKVARQVLGKEELSELGKNIQTAKKGRPASALR